VYDVSYYQKLTSFLERSGFEVRIATNGEEALANIEIEAPKMIVSDLLMPKIDGTRVTSLTT
jgi:CheY-like chemotaxis protein